ncbi:hypothetical protein ACTQ4E_05765 [Lawsonibacter sp. LCP25S3_G6]|uniref:hypothetical protein n=1 Tax=unclassified Lawsonibacter TaxID=2617946 RepID=UPI003F99782D
MPDENRRRPIFYPAYRVISYQINVTFLLKFTKSIDRQMESVYNNNIHWGTPQKWPGFVILLSQEKKFSLLNHFFARFHIPDLCGKIAAGEKGIPLQPLKEKNLVRSKLPRGREALK